MPTSYTSLLGLALPVTGELSGTWGDVVSNYITQYVDSAVAGTQTISGTQTAVTLSITNGSSLVTAGSGATGSAQFQIINCTGNPAGLLTITAPASSRQYIIINATSTSQSVKIVGTGPTTGVTILSGEKAHVAWNGSDFVKIATQSGNGDFVTVDTTNLEVTNIKAKDGTAAASIADSTGKITVTQQMTIDGIEVGQGAGNVSTNTAVGASALAANTTGFNNVAVGQIALTTNTGGAFNTAVGRAALNASTGDYNTGLGGNALVSNTTGSYNTGLGAQALNSNTTASNNTAVGYQAGYSNTTGSPNTFIGFQAGYSNSTGTNNTFVGRLTGYYTTTPSYNVAMGSPALYQNTTGSANVAIGDASLYWNTTGSNNTALGSSALQSNTTASNNTAVGYQAGYSNTTGTSNIYIGYRSGASITTNSNSTMVGMAAGEYTTGANNTFVGSGAGNAVTSGAKNTIIGTYNGNQGGLDIRTASNNIVLSDGDGNPNAFWASNKAIRTGGATSGLLTGSHTFRATDGSDWAIGIYTDWSTAGQNYGQRIKYTASAPNGTSNEFLYCEDSSALRASIRSNGGIANYQGNDANLSDRREKTNFAPAGEYLSKICAIPVQTFNYIDQNMEEDGGLTLGVVAQDVQAVAPELVQESNWGTEDDPKMRLSIYQTDLQYALMKCIQEQQALIQSLTARIAALESKGA